MALALLFENNDVMFLDAVVNYSKTRTSSISNHPIDSASVISDHVSKDNPNFTIKGVISAADFQRPDQRPQEILDSTEFSVDTAFNNPAEPATINQRSNLLSFLPGSVQQFLGSGTASTVELSEFRGYSHQVARDKIEKAWKDSEKLTLLDYDVDLFSGRSVSVRAFDNLILRRYADNETVDTGDSLEFTLEFTRIRTALIKEIDVSINRAPSSEVSDETSSESNEGDQTNESVDAQLRAIEQGSQNLGGFTSDLLGVDVSDNPFFQTGPSDLFEKFR